MSEEPGGCQKEQAPAALPAFGVRAVDLFHDGFDFSAIGVVVGEPIIRGAGVVLAAPSPRVLDFEKGAEMLASNNRILYT